MSDGKMFLPQCDFIFIDSYFVCEGPGLATLQKNTHSSLEGFEWERLQKLTIYEDKH